MNSLGKGDAKKSTPENIDIKVVNEEGMDQAKCRPQVHHSHRGVKSVRIFYNISFSFYRYLSTWIFCFFTLKARII